MKTILILLITPFFLFNTGDFKMAQDINNKGLLKTSNDRCTDWDSTSEYKYLYIRICEYESGGSGYYQFKNSYNKAVRFSFKIFHRNGDVTRGSTNVKSGQIHKASCFDCAEKNGGGNKSYEISKVYFEGDEGYW